MEKKRRQAGVRPHSSIFGNRYIDLFLMTDGAFGEFWFILFVAIQAKSMGRTLEGVNLLWHSSLAIVTRFAFFYFLSFLIS